MNRTSDICVSRIVSDLKKTVSNPTSEEVFTTKVAQTIEAVASSLGLTPRYDQGFLLVSDKRAHTLYDHVIIECIAPGIDSPAEFVNVNMINYIISEAQVKERFTSFFGVIISDRITFVTFNTVSNDWVVKGPYDINKKVILKIIAALRGLRKKRLCAEELLCDFGPQSEIALKTVTIFYDKLINVNNPKTTLLFEEWMRIFSQFTGYKEDDLRELDKFYGRKGCTKLLFCIHTYYALLVKIIAAEAAYLYGSSSNLKSYVAELEDKYVVGINEFKECLKDLEEGTLFKTLLKIKDFIEGDYFSWYLEEFDEELMDTIAEVAQKLSDYEYATPVLIPEETKDMLKTLYQELVPKPVRHNLGEYYTPDWLAQFLLDRVNFTTDFFEKMAEKDLTCDVTRVTTPFQLRLLDPACGSGTFLIEALKRLRIYAEDKCMTDTMADHICENIVGIDCNPLAVLAARTNYLLHVGDLLHQGRELPVHLADSLTLEKKPADVTLLSRFDYVVGNPPWVLWDNLPRDYRKDTRKLWKDYGLFTLTASQARHGGGKKDISILFTYVCADRYLKDSGTFGFLITQSVFKTKGAGEGFRRFTLKDTNLKVVEVHDFVSINPFEAHNRTTAIILKKGEKTVYPVRYMVWRASSDIEQKESLVTASKKLHSIEMAAIPSDCNNELSPWMTIPHNAVNIVQKVCGKNTYPVYEGINSGGANGVYWVTIVDAEHQSKIVDIPLSLGEPMGICEILVRELVVKNVTKGTKKPVEKVKTIIEDFFVYPALKSKHVRKWRITGYNYTLQMQDPLKRVGVNEEWVKATFPKTYAYLKRFEKVLLSRAAYKKFMNPRNAPFYSMYNVGYYTYAPYKVVWNRMGSRISACVISVVCDTYLGEKCVLPDNVLAFIPTENEGEAHYICSIMNSSITDMVLRSIAGGTKSFGTPKIVEDTIRIPLFNEDNELHKRLCDLSRKAHKIALKDKDTSKIEKEIDKLVAALYGVSEKDFHIVKKTLLLQEGEIPKEEY